MWASELIAILQKTTAEHGDVPVVVQCTAWDGGEPYRAFPQAETLQAQAPLRGDGSDGGVMVVIKEVEAC